MRAKFSLSIGQTALLAGVLTACGPAIPRHSQAYEEPGTCEIACDHYEYCKGTPDPDREQACIAECRIIFSEDGHVDGDSLRALEELSCRQLLSFIEGSDARPPGSSK